MSEIAYRPLSDAEKIFKDLVWVPMLKAGETWLEGAIPILAAPVIKQMDETLIEAIADAIFNAIVLTIDVESIKLVTAARQSAYDASSIRLMVIAAENGIESEEYKTARDEELAVMARFTHLGP